MVEILVFGILDVVADFDVFGFVKEVFGCFIVVRLWVADFGDFGICCLVFCSRFWELV